MFAKLTTECFAQICLKPLRNSHTQPIVNSSFYMSLEIKIRYALININERDIIAAWTLECTKRVFAGAINMTVLSCCMLEFL